jgi:hypothetical protein
MIAAARADHGSPGAPDPQAVEAVVRILCDCRPARRADALYLFAQTPDNEASVLAAAHRVMAESLAARCWISAASPWEGYRGADAWERALIDMGLKPDAIERVPFDAANHNTLTEARALVDFIVREGHSVVIVTAAPFHQVRAFMTTVACAERSSSALEIYSHPGAALDWTAAVRHSQGRLVAPRSRLIHAESERISTYGLQGDLISYPAVVEYLDRRDASNAL